MTTSGRAAGREKALSEPSRRRPPVLLIVGGAVALVGVVVTFVYFVQPWRSCDYGDTSAECAMLPEDAAVMTAAMVVTIVGLGLLVAGLAQRGLRRH